MTLNERASYVKIESNLLSETRYDIIKKKLLPKRNNLFDERYLWLEKSLLVNIDNMLEQRNILKTEKAEKIKLYKIKQKESHPPKQALKLRGSNVLSSNSNQIKFGIKTKRGDLYYYVTFESKEQKKLSKFRKITEDNLSAITKSWIYNNYQVFSQLESEPTVCPWSDTVIEQFIKKKLQKYAGLIKQS